MTMHPDEARLLRWLDEPMADEPVLAEHLAVCPDCQERLAVLADETAAWRAALALTPGEQALLFDANLPHRLMAAVQRGEVTAARPGGWHVLGLLGLCLAVALVWALLEPVVGPLLVWASRLIDINDLVLAALAGTLRAAVVLIVTAPEMTLLALMAELVGVAAAGLLGGLWLYRLRPAGALRDA